MRLTLLDNVRATRETTLLIVTHDADVARRARRLIEFRDGRIIGDHILGVAHAA